LKKQASTVRDTHTHVHTSTSRELTVKHARRGCGRAVTNLAYERGREVYLLVVARSAR